MAPLVLYGTPSVRTRTIRAIANYEKLDYELKMANDTPNFKELFPIGKKPALVDGDFHLSEVLALVAYLAGKNHSIATSSVLQTVKNAVGAGKPSLLGHNLREEAEILKWVSFGNAEYMPAVFSWFGPLNGLVGYNKKAVEDGKAACRKILKILDDHLLTRTYFVGETISAADIMIADVTQSGCSFVFDKPLRAEFPNLFRHYDTITNQDFYLPCTPEGKGPVYRDEAIKFTPPPKA